MQRPTEFLHALRSGDVEALEPLFVCVLAELRRRARLLLLNERAGHTLQPTGLVNEAFVRLFDGKPVPWENSAEFFASASREMRRVLTDHARRANAQKRQSRLSVELKDEHKAETADPYDSIEVDRALAALEVESPRAVSIVEMRFYGGLENAEIANILGINKRTVEREWAWARAWLQRHLARGAGRA